MLQRDPLLVRILFGGLLGALPKSRVDDIAAVFYDMIHVRLLALCLFTICFVSVSWQRR